MKVFPPPLRTLLFISFKWSPVFSLTVLVPLGLDMGWVSYSFLLPNYLLKFQFPPLQHSFSCQTTHHAFSIQPPTNLFTLPHSLKVLSPEPVSLLQPRYLKIHTPTSRALSPSTLLLLGLLSSTVPPPLPPRRHLTASPPKLL